MTSMTRPRDPYLATSSGHRGVVGYHDPELDVRLAEWDQAERDSGPDAA